MADVEAEASAFAADAAAFLCVMHSTARQVVEPSSHSQTAICNYA